MALLLAVVWLPMTMHCQLALLDICPALSGCCDQDHSCSGGDCGCESDVCKLIESGHFDLQASLQAVPGPTGLAAELTVVPPLAEAPVRIVSAEGGAPPGAGKVWQFAFRAAPAPRAPSGLC
jgi:hypothetical protein